MTNASLKTLLSYSRQSLIERALRHNIDANAYASKSELAQAIYAFENAPIDVTPNVENVENVDSVEIASAGDTPIKRIVSQMKSVRNGVRNLLDNAIDAKGERIERTFDSASASATLAIIAIKGEIRFIVGEFETNDQRALYAHLKAILFA